jgi:DNA mismatch repair ATPase MutS
LVELLLHKDLLVAVNACLEGFPDISKIIKAAVHHDSLQLSTKYGEALIHRALLLRRLLASLTELSGILEGQVLTSTFFTDAIQVSLRILRDAGLILVQVIKTNVLVELKGFLDECLEDGLCYSEKQSLQQNQRLFAVRSGFSALLDVARRTFKEVQDDIHEYATAWSQHANVKISVKFQSKRGYFFSILKSDLEGRDPDALCRTHVVQKSEILFSPLELAKLNERLKECMSEILLASQKCISAVDILCAN